MTTEEKSERRKEAEDTLEYAREQLADTLWGWIAARPQRADADAAVKALEAFLDAREALHRSR